MQKTKTDVNTTVYDGNMELDGDDESVLHSVQLDLGPQEHLQSCISSLTFSTAEAVNVRVSLERKLHWHAGVACIGPKDRNLSIPFSLAGTSDSQEK